MGVGPLQRTWACALAATVALAGSCQRGLESPTERCKQRALSLAADAVQVCRDAYAQDPDPLTAGRLAYAIVQTPPIDLDSLRAFAEQVGDTPGHAEVWHQYGEAPRKESRGADALVAYARALANRVETDTRGRAKDEYAIYDRLMRAEDLQGAAEHLASAYQLAENNGEPDLRRHVTLGAMNYFLELGDLRAAEGAGRAAAELVDRDSPYYSVLRMNQIQIDVAARHYDLAAIALNEMIAFAREMGNANLEHDARIDLVMVELGRGDPNAAAQALALDPENDEPIWRASRGVAAARIAYVEKRYADAERVAAGALSDEVDDWRARLLTERGRALAAMGRIDDARAALSEAIQIIEAERATLELDELKTWLLAERRAPYEALFALEAGKGDSAAALGIAQAATARTFLDTLIGSADQVAAAIPAAATGAAHRVEAMRAVARSIRSSPATTPLSVSELLRKLGKVTVLSYFLTEDAGWLITIDRGTTRLHRLALGRRELAGLLSRWLADLDDPEAARQLGAALVPDDALPARTTRIYIVPDELLHQLPFAALIVGGRHRPGRRTGDR
jgi:hypothetical protein